jgi:predicted transcriptional regulator
MTDKELVHQLGLDIQEVADLLGVKRPVVSRALSEVKPSRRGTAPGKSGSLKQRKHYFNLDRLLALLRYFQAKSDEKSKVSANLLRKTIEERHPEAAELIKGFLLTAQKVKDFVFSEAWIFSREPLEVHYTDFRQGMKVHLQHEKRRLVYFVPSKEVAAKLIAALRVAAEGEEKLIQVFVVITTAVLLSPHWCIVFVPSARNDGTDDVLVGVMPEPPEGKRIWEEALVKVPGSYFRDVRDTLMQAGLLNASDRFKKPATRNVGGGAIPEFEIYYPQIN